ncbi:hypothetical protein EG68_11388 [Paragonimus skrjabini miyazakii]|uniref:Uncharacterized protein n=1 Tax=Paragonimus skrjabini miyazakii TaxID=59628 RepID=A0A8S9YJL6_9TREM|nr:hypothetical protein EG68_11388 [Paragonimus skrjabini miyazakii]
MSDSESSSDLQELVACPGLYRELPETKPHINNKVGEFFANLYYLGRM